MTTSDLEGSLVTRFERLAADQADQPAISSGRRLLTYADLNRTANRIAHALLARRDDRHEPVGLLLRPGIAAITAIWAILKAGKFYVPLDTTLPAARLSALLEDARPGLLLSDAAGLAMARTLAGGSGETLDLDALDPGTTDSDTGVVVAPEAYAYVIYTSGSTGQPRGVMHTHRAVRFQMAEHARVLTLSPRDRVTWLHSHCFSASRLDIFGALVNGACVCHFDVATKGITGVAEWLVEEEVTILHWLPTAFRRLAGTLMEEANFPRLRAVVLGSEPLLAGDVDRFRRFFSPACALVNRYGTTETGTITSQAIDAHTPLPGGLAPVGHPIAGTSVSMLDHTGQEVEAGKVGEIAVMSAWLSSGYWRQPELTRARFVRLPATNTTLYRTGDLGYKLPDGSLVHIGRTDLQAKIRGYRIEVNEIEGALLAHPAVREAAVATTEGPAGSELLVAYMTALDDGRTTGSALRRYLAAVLPSHMIPSSFIWLDELPLTPNGKLDRMALRHCNGRSADLDTPGAEPGSALEHAIAQIWCRVLRLPRAGVHDSFLEVGGDSLSATSILVHVAQEFGIKIELGDFFESPTIAGLAELVSREEARGRLPNLPPGE